MTMENTKQRGRSPFFSRQTDANPRHFIAIIVLLLSAAPVYATEINKPVARAEQCSQVDKVDSNSRDEELPPLPARQNYEYT